MTDYLLQNKWNNKNTQIYSQFTTNTRAIGSGMGGTYTGFDHTTFQSSFSEISVKTFSK